MKYVHVIAFILIAFFALTTFGSTKNATSTVSQMSSITSKSGVVTSIDNVISISASNVLLSGSIKLGEVNINLIVQPLKDFEFFNTAPGYDTSALVPFYDMLIEKQLPNIISLNYNQFGYIPMKNIDIPTVDKSLDSMLVINYTRAGEIDLEYKDISTQDKPLNSLLFLNVDKTYESQMKYANILTQTMESTTSTKTTK